MTIYSLPQDIMPQQYAPSESIIFHDYSALTGTFKGKSILQKNAISMVITGEKTMHFAEKKVLVKSDEFHFLSAGNCMASVDLSRQKIFRSILIFFDNAVLTDFYIKYSAVADRIRPENKEPYIFFKKDHFVHNYITSLSLLLGAGKPPSAEMRLLKLEELLLHLLERYPKTLLSFRYDKGGNTGDLELKKAMEGNITGNLSLEELAFICNTSLSAFKRRCMKIYGTSPAKWLLQQRMNMAKDLLQHHGEKPGEVYYKVGYESHSSFSQSFRHAFGISPRDFQEQILNVQP